MRPCNAQLIDARYHQGAAIIQKQRIFRPDGDKIDDDSEEDEEEEEEDITSEATKESSPVASEVGKLKVAQLKDALKALGLPLGGTKSQLVARLQIGVPVFKVDSIGDKVHYDYEATNPLTKPLFVVRAVRKCQCIRW